MGQGHRVITGLRLNRYGALSRSGLVRDGNGGGLDRLALKVQCRPVQLELITLADWVQVWVNSDLSGQQPENPTLSRMVTELTGVKHSLGGAGWFIATVPHQWEMVGLNPEQEARLWEVWQSTTR